MISYSDYCPQECTGYASYSKSATNFENFDFPLYLIPTTAQQCSAIDAGCEEFTNLDVLGQGGEAKEYYKELRACVELPEGKSKCSTYYTWEGSEVTGYQLQAHELEKDTDNSPALVDAKYSAECNADIFAKKNNPDCRQFFDAAGKAYYKLFSNLPKNANVLVRSHPSDDNETIYRIASALDTKIMFANHLLLEDLIIISDVIIARPTTALIDAIILKKPVLYMGYSEKMECKPEFVNKTPRDFLRVKQKSVALSRLC